MPANYFSYVLTRDFGFAPNPFNGICTLATCKPKIRKAAVAGDWIFGTSSTRGGKRGRLIYAMKVTKKITFNEYWTDPQFETKKPVMNGSLKKMYGDNIYHHDGTEWIQIDSHHSLEGGSPNMKNVIKDTSADAVLISDNFYYFGEQSLEIPGDLIGYVVKKGQSHRCPKQEYGDKFIQYISSQCSTGYHCDPECFSLNQFERYDGTS